jgi:flagellar basal body-associated protein FliL
MKTEVKIAIISGIVAIIVAILTGVFGLLKKTETIPANQPFVSQQSAASSRTPLPSIQGNGGDVTIINGDGNIKAGGNITIQKAAK